MYLHFSGQHCLFLPDTNAILPLAITVRAEAFTSPSKYNTVAKTLHWPCFTCVVAFTIRIAGVLARFGKAMYKKALDLMGSQCRELLKYSDGYDPPVSTQTILKGISQINPPTTTVLWGKRWMHTATAEADAPKVYVYLALKFSKNTSKRCCTTPFVCGRRPLMVWF